MSRVALPREETRCDLEYFDGLLKLAGLYAPTSAGGHAGHHTAIDLGLTCPPAQRLRADPQRPTAPPSVNWGQIPGSAEISPSEHARRRQRTTPRRTCRSRPILTYSDAAAPNPVPVNNQGGGKRSCVSTGQARTTGGDGRVEVFLMGVGNLHHRKASTPPTTTRRSPLHPQLPKGRLLVYANRLQRVERIGGRAMYRVALGVEAHCVAANLGDDRRRHRPPFRSVEWLRPCASHAKCCPDRSAACERRAGRRHRR